MALVTQYGINLQYDSTLAPGEKPWQATIFYVPSVSASGPTAPSGTQVTNGPLGATGTAAAVYTHGDGTQTGFFNAEDALQRALLYIQGHRAANAQIPGGGPSSPVVF